jgi:hypothetical protein
VSRHTQPADLRPGDVVSPLFNPDMAIVFECWYVARLAEALPGAHAPDLGFDHPMTLVCGNRWHGEGLPEGAPTQLTIRVGDDVRLHLRDGKRVDR